MNDGKKEEKVGRTGRKEGRSWIATASHFRRVIFSPPKWHA